MSDQPTGSPAGRSGPLQNVSFPSNGGNAHGYLAVPQSGSGPGVVVIQEWWGLTEYIAGVVDRLAEAGFVALAPDLYGGLTTHDSGEAAGLMRALPVQQSTRELAGAVDLLLEHRAVIGEAVGAVGFCMGGGFVLTLAEQQGDRIAAAVPFYAALGSGERDLTRLTAQIQGHWAERDDTISIDEVEQLDAMIRARSGTKPEFYVYPAVRGFHNHLDPNTYDSDQAELAWERTLRFLHRELGGPVSDAGSAL